MSSKVFFNPKARMPQGYKTRKVNCVAILCVHIETSSLWAEFVNKNRCISLVRLVSEEVKMTRIFHWFFMWKMDPMSGFDIRLVFTLPPRESTLHYKRCVHLWNKFPCIITLGYPHLNFVCTGILIFTRSPWIFLTW